MISAANATAAISESLKSIATPVVEAESIRIGAGCTVVDLAISRHLWIRLTIGSAIAGTHTRARGVADRIYLARKPASVLLVVSA